MFGASQLTDDLVASAVDGTDTAVARLVRTLAPQVRLMVIARLSPNPNQLHAVDEITQLALVALTSALPRLENKTAAGLKAYLSRIVAHKVADFLKAPAAKAAPQHAVLRSLDSTINAFSEAAPLWQFLSESGASPLSAVANHDEVTRVMTELGRLRDPDREIITLAFFDQLTTSDIAQRIGVSRPAASMRLIRAVENLRRSVTGSSQIHNPHD